MQGPRPVQPLYAASSQHCAANSLAVFGGQAGLDKSITEGLPATPQHQVRLCMSIQVQVVNSRSPALTDDQGAGLLQ